MVRWSHPKRAHVLSNVSAMIVLPLASLGLPAWWSRSGEKDQLIRDGWQIAQAVSLTLALNQITKLAVGRDRPFVHASATDPTIERIYPASRSDHLSFFSGHSALAFALATSASVVATRRLPRAKAAAVSGSAFTCAAATAWLRMAADKHYATDVLAGAFIGSSIGFLSTWQRPNAEHSTISVESSVGRFVFNLSGRF
jgi:membrane-associated phospholipid phosphatase